MSSEVSSNSNQNPNEKCEEKPSGELNVTYLEESITSDRFYLFSTKREL